MNSVTYFCLVPRVMKAWSFTSTPHMSTFLTSALHGGGWSVSHSGHFTPGESTSSTPWIGGCMGSRARLDEVAKENPCPCWKLNFDC
jgi:hypothetical protein